MREIASLSQNSLSSAGYKPMLKMVPHERMAGTVPVWELPSTPAEKVAARLEAGPHLTENETAILSPNTNSFASAHPNKAAQKEEEFKFWDILDMINPLQHIPLVGTAYRHFTQDAIRPIGRIIGGSLFGGPLGAASGLVNVIIADETGKDIAENALSFVDHQPSKKTTTAAAPITNPYIIRMADSEATKAYNPPLVESYPLPPLEKVSPLHSVEEYNLNA